MKMRLARETGLAGKPDRLSRFYFIADFDQRSIGLEMVVISERAVGMFDNNVVPQRLKLRVRAAKRGIIAYAHDTAFARRADGGSFRHVPVHCVLASGANEMAVGPARPLH